MLFSSLTLPPMFRALKSKNYKLYFLAQLVSMSGTWMQTTVQGWLVYQLTHSGWWLGITTFASQIPAFFLSPIAGTIADKKDRKTILIVTQSIAMVQACLLAVLVWTHLIQVWHVVLLAAILGFQSAFDMVTRQAFAVDLVGKEDLPSAVTLNAVLFNIARVLGPAIAGILILKLGMGWCFFLNALSYVAILCTFFVIHTTPHFYENTGEKIIHGIREALYYSRHHSRIFKILLLSTFISVVAFPYLTLLPIFAKKILHGDERTLAWLTAMPGFGAVFGSLAFATSVEGNRFKRQLIACTFFAGIGLVILGVSETLWISLVGIFLLGFFLTGSLPLLNNGIQQVVSDQMRARVLSLYIMVLVGGGPLGSLFVGWASDLIGAPLITIGLGGICMTLGIGLWLRALRN